MTLRQRLENLPVGQKLLAALLVLLVTILLVANLTFISAAYWITQESMAPQALQGMSRLVSNPQLRPDERRVGIECRPRWSTTQYTQK